MGRARRPCQDKKMAQTLSNIPRAVLFGNPERATPRLSPDATQMAYLAPDEGVLNVWVMPASGEEARVVTQDRGSGIREYYWAEDGVHLLYLQDKDGDENWHLWAVNLRDGGIRDLTPYDKVTVQGIKSDRHHPAELLVEMNKRDERLFDIHRVQLADGATTLEHENPGHYLGWMADHDFQVRGAVAATADGGSQLWVSKEPGGEFEEFLTWGPEDNGGPLAFTPDGKGLYIADSLGRDTVRLYTIDLVSRDEQTLSTDERVDAGPALVHPTKHHVQAVGYNLHRLEWVILDDDVRGDFEKLAAVRDGELNIVSRDTADGTWLVAFTTDDAPVHYYRWDRASQTATYMFSNRPDLEEQPLTNMKPVTIRSRDGLDLHSYLTMPRGAGERPNLPMVLNVHGGPWARDSWGYDPEAQWLANRGYAVLQVNFRGSTGFGKSFLNAGNREWGAKMHDDLLDAVEWAVSEGYADPAKVAIYGGSYGGYAALAGAAFTPEVFCCAVDIVGPSNICTLIESVPPYWEPAMNMFRVRVGDIEKERDFLEARSPLFKADQIQIPMLIVQGANDPRVKRAESDQIVAELRKKEKDVVYLLFEDEGHGFDKPQNRMAFYAAAEEFLARHLGGTTEGASGEESEILARARVTS